MKRVQLMNWLLTSMGVKYPESWWSNSIISKSSFQCNNEMNIRETKNISIEKIDFLVFWFLFKRFLIVKVENKWNNFNDTFFWT
jgi:hypothetical protein